MIPEPRNRIFLIRILLPVLILSILSACASSHQGASGIKGSNGKTAQMDDTAPILKNAQVRKLWIPPKIEGSKYTEGHYVFIIERNNEWESNSR